MLSDSMLSLVLSASSARVTGSSSSRLEVDVDGACATEPEGSSPFYDKWGESEAKCRGRCSDEDKCTAYEFCGTTTPEGKQRDSAGNCRLFKDTVTGTLNVPGVHCHRKQPCSSDGAPADCHTWLWDPNAAAPTPPAGLWEPNAAAPTPAAAAATATATATAKSGVLYKKMQQRPPAPPAPPPRTRTAPPR